MNMVQCLRAEIMGGTSLSFLQHYIYIVSPHHIIIQMSLRENLFLPQVFKLDLQLSPKLYFLLENITFSFIFQKTISH